MALISRIVGPRGPTGPWSRGYELKIIFSKLHELQTTLNEKAQNNRRLEAQRNDLNGKVRTISQMTESDWSILGEDVTRRTSIITGTRILCRRSYQANGQKESFRKLFKTDSISAFWFWIRVGVRSKMVWISSDYELGTAPYKGQGHFQIRVRLGEIQ